MSNVADYRYGEPPPVESSSPSMHDIVIKEMVKRKIHGMEKYKTILQAFNGRRASRDAMDEILDLVVYFQQLLYEEERVILLIKITHDGERVGQLRIFREGEDLSEEIADYTVEMTVERGNDVVSVHRRTLVDFPRNAINSIGLLKAALNLFDSEQLGLEDDFDRYSECVSTALERRLKGIVQQIQAGQS